MLVPDFLCQDVVETLVGEIAVESYPDDPWSSPSFPQAGSGDAVLVVPYFGLRSPVVPIGAVRCDIIEDHTHDPWSTWAQTSDADFCVASLRKTLPVPEGGVVWSPRAHPIGEAPVTTMTRALAAGRKRDAMTLKAAYLDGAGISKEDFRALAMSGESEIASGEISGMTAMTRIELPILPAALWRLVRRANHSLLADRLRDLGWLAISLACDDAVPFALIALVDDAERRDRIRRTLMEQRIYPPVLWPLEQTVVDVRSAARELSRRVLVLHCDARYDRVAIERVAVAVRAAGGA
jgi:hypothetical protein